MSVLKFARNAAVVAAAVLLPAQAIAATPTTVPSAFGSIVRAGADTDEANGQFAEFNDFIVPAVIVIALGLGLYFILDEEEDDTLPTSP